MCDHNISEMKSVLNAFGCVGLACLRQIAATVFYALIVQRISCVVELYTETGLGLLLLHFICSYYTIHVTG
ncbi:hypothetical protein AXG93_3267s1030 [Marchantia polymorpha subsp. ruderalis]|uniref:Uncharacterized protein n=1 Tax=Marchantia polymorpha subsp. ruderalis TaxID=1480154 RepID=A0A176WQ38_MARPO|nr:hypothetical protein AXG93_3267s1030 [Marchantia polymorpha subsp. ruderalis]